MNILGIHIPASHNKWAQWSQTLVGLCIGYARRRLSIMQTALRHLVLRTRSGALEIQLVTLLTAGHSSAVSSMRRAVSLVEMNC